MNNQIITGSIDPQKLYEEVKKVSQSKEVNIDRVLGEKRAKSNGDGTLTLPKRKQRQTSNSSRGSGLRRLVKLLTDGEQESELSDRDRSPESRRKNRPLFIDD